MNFNSAPTDDATFLVSSSGPDSYPAPDVNRKFIALAFWLFAIVAGAVQTWFFRHNMIADGISYLEIAANYLRGNWTDALNPYWSPLYSWALALAFTLIRPTPYWQLATLHLVNFLGFLLGLGVLEWLMSEVDCYRIELGSKRTQSELSKGVQWLPLSSRTFYIVGYSAHIFAGLFLISISFCSPDLLAMCLTYALGALTVRMLRNGTAPWMFVVAGLLFGLAFLARAAFMTLAPVYLIVFAAILRKKRRTLWMPLTITLAFFALVAVPFIAAISIKEHRLTFGDSGRLNYSWEVCGAARWMHWQGEPYDIGKPLHPTTKVSDSPVAYTFDNDQPGTYPPWYNPSYWYAGIKPHLKLVPQLRVFFFNLTYAVRLLLAFPLTLPALLLLVLAGRASFRFQVSRWWPLFVPPMASILIYCLVFLDKRYVAASIVVIWLSAACCVRTPLKFRTISDAGLQAVHLVLLAVLLVSQFRIPAKLALHDIVDGHEREHNLQALLSDRFLQLGLNPGDKIAYLGVTFNADWTRLDDVKIVGEVPVIYVRHWKAFSSNVSHDDTSQLQKFWDSDANTQNKILDAFKKAGAKMIVTDGTFSKEADARGWRTALSPRPSGVPFSGGQNLTQIDTRFLMLEPNPK